MKNLEIYGVQEMNTQEMKKTDGGNPFWVLVGAGILIGAAIEIMGDWDNLIAGLTGQCKIPN